MNIIDISVPLRNQMPTWPGSPGFNLIRWQSIENGDPVNNSSLVCDVHIGTHIDAPSHFFPSGITIDQLPIEVLIGPAFVVYMPHLEVITAKDLNILGIPDETTRLLFHTDNSKLWRNEIKEFYKDFVALTSDAARWIVQRGIRLVGIDYLSVQRYADGPETHRILLRNNVIIVEGLNLDEVNSGFYELICLPLRIMGAEGSPARAVLRHFSKTS
jgi:arylformamidase